MLKVHWDSLGKVAQINCPVMFVTGDLDSFVPTHMTKQLHDKCGSAKKELWVVQGGNHNDTWMVAG